MKLTRIKRQSVLFLTAAAASIGIAAVALATPPSGVTATVFARASFADATDVKFKIDGGSQEVIQVDNAQQSVVQQIVMTPGGSTGWHSHPGPVVVMIKSGEMTLYSSEDPTCSPRTYTAGQAFVDSGQGHVHMARNESATQNLEFWCTYFDVPPGQPFRIDAPDPGNCSS